MCAYQYKMSFLPLLESFFLFLFKYNVSLDLFPCAIYSCVVVSFSIFFVGLLYCVRVTASQPIYRLFCQQTAGYIDPETKRIACLPAIIRNILHFPWHSSNHRKTKGNSVAERYFSYKDSHGSSFLLYAISDAILNNKYLSACNKHQKIEFKTRYLYNPALIYGKIDQITNYILLKHSFSSVPILVIFFSI